MMFNANDDAQNDFDNMDLGEGDTVNLLDRLIGGDD